MPSVWPGGWVRDTGQAAPIERDVLCYLFVGAASQPYVTAAEARLLAGRDPATLSGSTRTLRHWTASSFLVFPGATEPSSSPRSSIDAGDEALGARGGCQNFLLAGAF